MAERRSTRLERMEQTFYRLSQQHLKRDAASSAPITVAQYSCLRYLAVQPRQVSEVARHLDITTAGTTGLLDRLVEHGMVERRRDEEDRRLVWVSIAPKGLEAIAAMQASRVEFLTSLFSPLTDNEFDTFMDLVEKITDPSTQAVK
ncbi:MAG TPA: MarR family transcriptional regulator [Symbiobacteriaceae bacterium]|nr:MarR family transcriptional regulator [Symbiobacteriaceae bacterium]